jgi:hypothetical protein
MILLRGSIKPGAFLEEKTTALPTADLNAYRQQDVGLITTVSGGTVQITLDPQGTTRSRTSRMHSFSFPKSPGSS